MKHLPVLLAFLITPFFCFSQHCGTTQLEAEKEKKYPGYKEQKDQLNALINDAVKRMASSRTTADERIYQIPVVVHVIHNTSNGRIGGLKNPNITDAQITSQIQVLNEDFRKIENSKGFNNNPVGADTKIEFCLSSRDPNGNTTTGIVRKYYNKSTWGQGGSDEELMKSLSYWPSDQYLNIWVVDLEDLSNGALLGYSPFPFNSNTYIPGIEKSGVDEKLDGVTIDYENFGKLTGLRKNYDLGRTATHEIGHFLGLYHIWGDQDCGDDFVADTPKDRKPNKTGTCKDSSNCGSDTFVYTPDLSSNYLDYSYDKCMNIFTDGQKLRMRAVLEHVDRRKSLINSPGCCGGNKLEVGPYSEGFEGTEDNAQNWKVFNPGLNDYFTYPAGAYGLSSKSYTFQPSGVFSGDTAISKDFGFLVSPYNFLQHTDHPFLSFDMAYAGVPDKSITDSLVISYQINCGKWIPVKVFSGADLITTSRSSFNFIPGKEDWKTYSFEIPELKNRTVGRYRAEYYSKGINRLYIDNFYIYETAESITLTPYPNPAADQLTLKTVFEGEKDIQIRIYSTLGALIYEEFLPHTKSFSLPVNISAFNPGIYFIHAINGKDKVTARFLKIH